MEAAPAGGPARPAERRLSFAFAKRHGVLVRHTADGIADCAHRSDVTPIAIAEVRRHLRSLLIS